MNMKMEFYAEGNDPICDICQDGYVRQSAPPEAIWVHDAADPKKTVVVQCCTRCQRDLKAQLAAGNKVTNAIKIQQS